MMMEPLDYLRHLEAEGFTCYIVGGYTRNKLLGLTSTDIDIATSARPEDIAKIFKTSNKDNLGSINIKDANWNIDITTYRKEASYLDRHPRVVEYIENIDEDLQRRDFTMNAICLRSDGSIYDPLDGAKDLADGVIRVIGDVDTKFRDDPLRMLRALRMSIIYDFTIEKEALEYIISHKNMIKNLSYERKRLEMDKILSSGKAAEGLNYLASIDILDSLDIKVKDYHKVGDILGSWAQLEYRGYTFSKQEERHLINIRNLLDRSSIGADELYTYGLYDCTVAAEILGIPKERIQSIYKSMPIHEGKELVLNGNEIMNISGQRSGTLIKEIKKDLIRQVLSGNLPNNESELSNYILKNWK